MLQFVAYINTRESLNLENIPSGGLRSWKTSVKQRSKPRLKGHIRGNISYIRRLIQEYSNKFRLRSIGTPAL